MFPKPKRYTNETYLEHVRCLPCCAPGCKQKNISGPNKGKVDPHHTRSVKAGGSDLTAIPLCREHHTEVHWSQVKFQEKCGIDFKEIQIECLQQFIEEKIP
ncbi:DUF968 domain-containing protein [Candidatus Pacearchaeota archaeon]|nr:DUF968 domain-containing protein [Candidatus Pacearchaeota archaeon]